MQSTTTPMVRLSDESKVSIDLRNYYGSDDSDHDAEYVLDKGFADNVGLGKMLLLTCSMFGLQLIWSVLMVNGTVSRSEHPTVQAYGLRMESFLLSMGFPKSLTALVWMAGPLCGAIVQPIVGAHSDRCTHPWGRRKPYIIGGTASTVLCILGLAYTESLLRSFLSIIDMKLDESEMQTLSQIIALLWIYALNVSIQPLQAGLRSLIVEQCPPHDQANATAWAGRFVALGNVFMCAIGFTGVPRWLPPGINHFHFLVVIATSTLIFTVSLTCLSIGEDRQSGCTKYNDSSIFANISRSIGQIPRLTRKVCQVQFVSWLGWFPFLFYNASYIRDLYMRTITCEYTSLSADDLKAAQEEAARLGNLSGLMTALVALSVAIGLPLCMGDNTSTFDRDKYSPHQNLRTRLLGRLWASSHVLFATCMFSTLFIDDHINGITLMSVVGASWAVTTWVPHALIGSDIAAHAALARNGNESPPSGNRNFHNPRVGAIMGLHNLAIAGPQILSALASSALFYALSYMGLEGDTAWVLRAGALASTIAAFMIAQLI